MENIMNDSKISMFEDFSAGEEKNKISKETVMEIFNFWVKTLRTSMRGPSPVLTPGRDKKIRKAIELYGHETCIQAIEGCALSDFHMGKNKGGRRYDDIELILRDAKHIEQFVQYYQDANTGGGFLDEE
jgi:hypothetical protein